MDILSQSCFYVDRALCKKWLSRLGYSFPPRRNPDGVTNVFLSGILAWHIKLCYIKFFSGVRARNTDSNEGVEETSSDAVICFCRVDIKSTQISIRQLSLAVFFYDIIYQNVVYLYEVIFQNISEHSLIQNLKAWLYFLLFALHLCMYKSKKKNLHLAW